MAFMILLVVFMVLMNLCTVYMVYRADYEREMREIQRKRTDFFEHGPRNIPPNNTQQQINAVNARFDVDRIASIRFVVRKYSSIKL